MEALSALRGKEARTPTQATGRSALDAGRAPSALSAPQDSPGLGLEEKEEVREPDGWSNVCEPRPDPRRPPRAPRALAWHPGSPRAQLLDVIDGAGQSAGGWGP